MISRIIIFACYRNFTHPFKFNTSSILSLKTFPNGFGEVFIAQTFILPSAVTYMPLSTQKQSDQVHGAFPFIRFLYFDFK